MNRSTMKAAYFFFTFNVIIRSMWSFEFDLRISRTGKILTNFRPEFIDWFASTVPAAYCNQIWLTQLYINSAQNTSVNWIIWLLLSHKCRPKVILLSGGHCICSILLDSSSWKSLRILQSRNWPHSIDLPWLCSPSSQYPTFPFFPFSSRLLVSSKVKHNITLF